MDQTRPGKPGPPMGRLRRDFDKSPFIVFYEVTRSCDLECVHCRACAQTQADPNELTGVESKALISRLAEFPEPPLLVITGGDPLKRADVFDLIGHSVGLGLETAITPSPTPLVTTEAIGRLKQAGIARMAVSIDGADAPTHDLMRGVDGSFEQTRRIMADALRFGIPLQVNTTLNPHNYDQLEAIAALLTGENVVLWSVFLIVPVGRATADLRLTGEQYEAAFERLWQLSQKTPFVIKTTEGMHYRRFVLQHRNEVEGEGPRLSARGAWGQGHGFPGVNDGRGIMFVSHTGLIHPSGFLPMVCGMYPFNDPIDVYQNSPIFKRLRDANSFGGKCGVCEYRHLCGGSRARAYSVTGDPYSAEPDCVYLPPKWLEAAEALATL
jgi:AdoMet-dependent heme synthase